MAQLGDRAPWGPRPHILVISPAKHRIWAPGEFFLSAASAHSSSKRPAQHPPASKRHGQAGWESLALQMLPRTMCFPITCPYPPVCTEAMTPPLFPSWAKPTSKVPGPLLSQTFSNKTVHSTSYLEIQHCPASCKVTAMPPLPERVSRYEPPVCAQPPGTCSPSSCICFIQL